MTLKNKSILAKRDDGFTISLAKWKDYSKIIELVDNMSEESKQYYQPWMFRKIPGLKIRLGQILARCSLVSIIAKFIKNLFPNGYAVILKCESSDNEIAGTQCMYNFKRLPNGKYMVTESKAIFDKFQNMGLSGFITESFIEIARKENVGIVRSGTRSDNTRNKKTYLKYGWKHKETISGAHKYKGKTYDNQIWILEL